MANTRDATRVLEEDTTLEEGTISPRERKNITIVKLKRTRQHAREVAPFVPLEDFDYSWLRAGNPYEFVEYGEMAHLRHA